MTDAPYELEWSRTARRAIGELLSEQVTVAAVEFITGPLASNPQRLGNALGAELSGTHSARLMQSWRVLYEIDEAEHLVTVLDIRDRAMPTGGVEAGSRNPSYPDGEHWSPRALVGTGGRPGESLGGTMYDYDLLVIGSGPGGQKAAIAGAKLERRTAIVEKKHMVGGVCINTGTIPSKTMREAILYLTGLNQRELYGHSYRLKEDINVADLTARTQHVIGREIDVIRSQLARNHVALLPGTARFLDDHTVAVTAEDGSDRKVTSERFVIAVGTRPARPDTVEFDGAKIVDSDQILELDHIPPSMVVVGAGVIGIEYASMFAALGTKVTVVERRDRMLEFCDLEIVEALKYQLRDLAVTFRFRETVSSVSLHGAGTLTQLESGKKIPADTVMYSAGRQGVTEGLDLPNAGLEADDRGRIVVDDNYLTSVPHIYAVGDVIGFPALAATSMEQGRRAAYHACDEPVIGTLSQLQPIGIYTIPEISYVGQTEDELTESSIPFEVGVSRYRELARGAILGDSYGMLKLLVHAENRNLLGVHVFGSNATELVHIGQTVIGCGGTVDYLVDAVFNYPTLAESYKVAALDAVNKMRTLARMTD